MFREQKRYGKDPNVVVRAAAGTFKSPLKWKDPAKVFTCSWSDWFIEEADPWRDEAWDIIRRTPHLTYQILTKRPENILSRLPSNWGDGWDNVWLGVSVEDQSTAIIRIPFLLAVPAVVRFLSCEPLLGSVDLLPTFAPYPYAYWLQFGEHTPYGTRPIHWVIVGGESGLGCRSMDPRWARDIRDDCKKSGVAFFMKQMGGYPDKHGEIPPDLQVFEFPNDRD